jgi:hypothetical protein
VCIFTYYVNFWGSRVPKNISALLPLFLLISACGHNENDPPNEAVDTTPDTANPEVRASIAAASGVTVVNDRFACTFGDRIGPDFKIIITDIGGEPGMVAGVYQVSGGASTSMGTAWFAVMITGMIFKMARGPCAEPGFYRLRMAACMRW